MSARTDKHLRISHSSLELFRSCPRKFEFHKFYDHSRRGTGLAAEVGKALHAGYQTFLTTGSEDDAIAAYMFAYPIELCSDWKNYRSLEAGYATLQALIHSKNADVYEISQVQCTDGQLRPAIEVPFEIKLAGFSLDGQFAQDGTPCFPVSYIGFIDLFLYNKLDNEHSVVDIKSHRQSVKDMSPVYTFDEQCVPYSIVLEHAMGHAITGLDVEYLSAYVDLMEPRVNCFKFHKSKEDVADWLTGIVVDLQMIKNFYRLDWFKRHAKSCLAFNRPCKFFDICATRNAEKIQKIFTTETEELDADTEQEFKPWISVELEVADAA